MKRSEELFNISVNAGVNGAYDDPHINVLHSSLVLVASELAALRELLEERWPRASKAGGVGWQQGDGQEHEREGTT